MRTRFPLHDVPLSPASLNALSPDCLPVLWAVSVLAPILRVQRHETAAMGVASACIARI